MLCAVVERDARSSSLAQDFSLVQRAFRPDDRVLQGERSFMHARLRDGPALVDVHGPVATIHLNRPQKLNALDAALIDRVQQLLDFVESEPAIRSVILTGAGERAFSAGADIAELRETITNGSG